MVFKHFRFICTVRILLIAASAAALVWLVLHTSLYATMTIVALIIIYEIWSLIHYVEKSNRDLERFLLSIKHDDFSQTFSSAGRGGSFRGLQDAFNDVIEEFQQTRTLAEERLHYLQTIVQHIGVGLIAVGADGTVELANPAAKRMLGVSPLRDLRAIEDKYPALARDIYALDAGVRKLSRIQRDDETVHLSLEATVFKQRDQAIKLVSLQDVTSELAEREMEAWQKLVRVLTHEIMNSVTPIASLAGTIGDLVSPTAGAGEGAASADIRDAAKTIERRSEGLVEFIQSYKSLTRIPQPNFQIVSVGEMLKRVEQLTAAVRGSSVAIGRHVEPDGLEVTADPSLIEQVLINLVNNAVWALKDTPEARIDLWGKLNERGRVLIQVIDNGPGIEPSVLDRIFIPFFSTKPDGTGIGLSLSRQIMRLHRGDLNASSAPGERTVFVLRF